VSETEDAKPSREDAVTQALETAGLHESQASLIDFYLDRPDGSWRDCCGSNCVPCALQIAQAVDKARALLGLASS
jgi:hypothetical protein